MRAAVARAVTGNEAAVGTALTVLLAGGHLLVEDVPGVGKTLLATSLAAAIGASMSRVQFTPDLMPSDLSGVGIFDRQSREFEFRPGSLFANVVLGDEINRASPKTQSAMLEAMEEGQVSVDGTTHRLPEPFLVIATQNPVEMEGTYPLPEAQRDRFMARVALGYPSAESEMQMLELHGRDPASARRGADEVPQVSDIGDVRALRSATSAVYLSESVKRLIVDLVGATRRSPDLRLGASPRASLHLSKAARAHAALRGRDHVIPDDVLDLAIPVLAHRVLLSHESRVSMRAAEDIVAGIAGSVPVPRVKHRP
jgi:MoxR-like ATPase